MEIPNLSRIIDTYMPISPNDLTVYLNQLKRDILPHIRKLQKNGHLRWFSFLLHSPGHLNGREPEDGQFFIHLRMEPASSIDLKAFIGLLPPHFRKPQIVTLSEISGISGNSLCDNNWAHAWKIHGEASEWILCLLEGHKDEPTLQHVIQFLHFITNPLTLGHRCLFFPGGFLQF